jgi:MFS family permease
VPASLHAPSRAGPPYNAAYKRLVTLLLMLAYTFNAADRGLISIVAQSMKLDLRLSDAQLGVLAGTAFASLYAASSIPIARLAERFNRVTIISLALAVWSGLTALCGAAGSFTQLLALRVGVGIGEAGCSAPAHSLISDYYERSRRASALSIYSCGLSLGYLFVSVVGGYVVLHYGWRAACVAVGLPGIAVAILINRLVEEPARGQADRAAAGDGALGPEPSVPLVTPFSVRNEARELAAVARALFLSWPAANIILGLTISSFASYGAWVFIPAYFNRVFALDFATIGIVLGLAGSVPVALGTLLGGFVTDRAAARGAEWYALVPALGLAVATPLYVLAFSLPRWQSAAWLLAAAGFFQYISLGPTFAVVQNVVDARRRATATAMLYVCLTLLALAGGPPFTGWMIDRLAEVRYAHPGSGFLADVIAAFGGARDTAGAAAATFRASCPGGVGSAACVAALARASREGIIVTFCLYVWSVVHYGLGAIGLAGQMRAADGGLARSAAPQVSSR